MFDSFKIKINHIFTLAVVFLFTIIAATSVIPPKMALAEGGRDKEEFRFKNSPQSKKKVKKTTVKKKKSRTASTRRVKSKNRVKSKRKTIRIARTERVRQLLVAFPANTSDDVIAAIGTKYGLRRIADSTIVLINQRVVKFALRRQISRGRLQRLINETQVNSAQPNYLYNLAAKNLPQYATTLLKINEVHEISKGVGITIAILDSGVFGDHPALKNLVAGQFDVVGKPKKRFTNHGTGIASIIVASGKMVGIAPKSRLLSARVFAADRRGGPLVAETYNLMRGIDWAIGEKTAIINMSFAGPKDKLFEQAIIEAGKKGIILVAAVGNQGSRRPVAFPAAYEQVIAVTATGIKNRIYRRANRGKKVMLAAPGVDIFVARRTRSYGLMTGTSAAAAYVSAGIALVLQTRPDMTPVEVAASLTNVATDLGPKGRDTKFGYGLLNVYEAIRQTQ